ncbi:MAG: SCP2 sterol-binding domain-containing protein [Deltaproteobacteria bacterium]|nr:SCP2 sterol-binding domain-containing protein [Deltaproteobacteria bacterium]
MADVNDFFQNYLPNKLANNPNLAKDINAVYVFDIDGAGTWTVDLTKSEITPTRHDDPGCVVSAKKADFEGMLDNPSSAMILFTLGKLKVTNVGLALSLQKLLG